MNTQSFQAFSVSRETSGALPAQRKSARHFLLCTCAYILLLSGASSSVGVLAYNVDIADDDNSAAHEIMTEAALNLYLNLAEDDELQPHPVAQEISDHWSWIRRGVTNPDEFDPLYGNEDIGLTTITHFFDSDASIEFPSIGPVVPVVDHYANAFNAAQALWTRALGEYAVDNKVGAYRFLGMVAHFLGDQSIPTHAHNDLHGPDWLDDDAFEEWMSFGTPSMQAPLSGAEEDLLYNQGLLNYPVLEPHNQLLWIFLNVNQVADYFGSDQENGDDSPPSEFGSYAQGAIDDVKAACALEPAPFCPTTADRLDNNDGDDVCCSASWDDTVDNDLQLIRNHSYLNGVRGLATLLALWEEVVRLPILNLTVHSIEEKGAETLDDAFSGEADFYVGIVMGQNNRPLTGQGLPPGQIQTYLNAPPGAYWNRLGIAGNPFRKQIDGVDYPSNVTRYDAIFHNEGVPWDFFGKDRHGTEDQKRIEPNYHFGQAYRYAPGTDDYVADTDIVNISLSVWEDDPLIVVTDSAYSDDDLVDVENVVGLRTVHISVDLGKAATETSGAVRLPNIFDEIICGFCGTEGPGFNIGQQISREGGDEGDLVTPDDDAYITFSVSLVIPDTEPPVITCAGPDGIWHATDVSIACTAVDEGSGLADPGDAAFELWTAVPDGTETDNALTGTREVCDKVGNCATAGPIGGNKVDKKAPVITIEEPMSREYTHSDTLVLDYAVTDGGSGVSTVSSTMDGSDTVAGSGLPSGREILLLTSLALGDHTFAVEAEDNVGNVSPKVSVTFSIVVTPESLIEAIKIFRNLGEVETMLVSPLLATLQNAADKFNAGDCSTAANIYEAFINQVQAQTGKGISPSAAEILILDAQYLIANC